MASKHLALVYLAACGRSWELFNYWAEQFLENVAIILNFISMQGTLQIISLVSCSNCLSPWVDMQWLGSVPNTEDPASEEMWDKHASIVLYQLILAYTFYRDSSILLEFSWQQFERRKTPANACIEFYTVQLEFYTVQFVGIGESYMFTCQNS